MVKKNKELIELNKAEEEVFDTLVKRIQRGLDFVSTEKDEYRKAEVMRWICRRVRSFYSETNFYESEVASLQEEYEGPKDKLRWTCRGKFEFESDEK